MKKRAANGRPVNLRSNTRIGARVRGKCSVLRPVSEPYCSLGGKKIGCDGSNHIDRATNALLWANHAGRKVSSAFSQLTHPSLAARTSSAQEKIEFEEHDSAEVYA